VGCDKKTRCQETCCADVLQLFVSRNSTDTDWFLLAQGTVRTRTGHIWLKEQCGQDWSHLVQGTVRTRTGLVWFKERCGHGLVSFGSRNGADTDWTLLAQGTVRTRTGLFWLKERCGYGLVSFGSRNGADMERSVLAQGTVPDCCKHTNKLAGCSQNSFMG
jgi:hypothetical protein